MIDQLSIPALPVPVPPMLEQAIDYSGTAQFVAFYWSPMGDEAMYDDGVVSADGQWPAYQTFIYHPKVAPHLRPYNLGSSDGEATHWLLLDRTERKLYALPAGQAAVVLHQQWNNRPDAPPHLAALSDLQSVVNAFADMTGWQEIQVDMAEVERRMQAHQARLNELVAWLDQA